MFYNPSFRQTRVISLKLKVSPIFMCALIMRLQQLLLLLLIIIKIIIMSEFLERLSM